MTGVWENDASHAAFALEDAPGRTSFGMADRVPEHAVYANLSDAKPSKEEVARIRGAEQALTPYVPGPKPASRKHVTKPASPGRGNNRIPVKFWDGEKVHSCKSILEMRIEFSRKMGTYAIGKLHNEGFYRWEDGAVVWSDKSPLTPDCVLEAIAMREAKGGKR